MSTVVTINGNTYTFQDDFIADRGYLEKFPAIIGDVVTVAGQVETNKTAVETALTSTGLTASSSSSVAIGIGSKSLTVDTGKYFSEGQRIKIAYTTDPDNYMTGLVTSYDSGTGALVVNIDATEGSGTQTSWAVYPCDTPWQYISETDTLTGLFSDGDHTFGFTYEERELQTLTIVAGSGSATSATAYISTDETSASGTAITGGVMVPSTTVDSNTLTANNTTTAGQKNYLVFDVSGASSLRDIFIELTYRIQVSV